MNWLVRSIKNFVGFWFILNTYLFSTVTGCVSIPAFAFLVGISVVIMSSAVGLKLCVITAEIKKYKSIIMKRKKKHDEIVLLLKSKLNSIDVLISKDIKIQILVMINLF